MTLPSFIYPDWPAPKHIKAYVSTRGGGFSQAPFDSLNVAQHVNDDAAVVAKNRTLLPMYENINWLTQIHSTTCINLDIKQPSKIEADASYSCIKNQVSAVMTADCLPLLLCDTKGTVVGAIHAGWRGLAAGVIENTLTAMGVKPSEMLVWLGPAISQSNFEVGRDVKDAFDNYPEAFVASNLADSDKFLADLYLIARLKLQSLGVSKIFGGEFCTYEQKDLFFSHRRATHEMIATGGKPSHATTGRMLSAIYIS
ncbi:peptidoglycan editing factor PgeF [Paraglaciecola sp. 2405UD69-4]|uniref:peptidoglycan editing factor PgeF n=1 Tax=Paraglaciecola sp. 2405UD69-4 TaxID=3391836 RepID=UPI0039C98A85